MKFLRSGRLRPRWFSLALTLAAGTLWSACDKDSSDPTAVTVEDLKFAFGLRIQDQGNGNIRLWWTGMNNEEDFSGYNIYGVKENTAVAAKKGQVIKLLTSDGEQDPEGKDLLSKMGYNGKDWETAGTEKKEDSEIAYYPYYKDKTVLPSCYPQGDKKECKVEKATDKVSLNGTTYLDLSGLAIGSNYCFVVVATMDEATKVAPTTSEVACVTPRSKITGTLTAGEGVKSPLKIDLATLRTKCSTTGGTACGTLTQYTSTLTDLCEANNSEGFCFEYFNASAMFNGVKTFFVQDLGYYAEGINPASIDDDNIPTNYKIKSLLDYQSTDGYSISGQSLPLQEKHIYAVASSFDATKKESYYDLIYVSQINKNTITVDVRVSGKKE